MADNTEEFRTRLLLDIASIKSSVDIMNVEMRSLKERVEHANLNNKAFKNIIDADIQDLRVSIQGNESKGIKGIASRISSFSSELTDHILQDRWAYGVMIAILTTTLGWTVFHK